MKESVERKVAAIVAQMEGLTYIFDNWATANVRLSDLPMPAMINVLPVSGKFSIGKQQIVDSPNCMFAFADLADMDIDGVENDEVIERCKTRAKEFIKRVNASGEFEYVDGDIFYSVFYDRLDVNVTGITIEVKLREVRGETLCL